MAYNEEHGIEPQTIQKAVRDTIRARETIAEHAARTVPVEVVGELAAADLDGLIRALEEEMQAAAKDLEFERAAELRDEIEELREMTAGR